MMPQSSFRGTGNGAQKLKSNGTFGKQLYIDIMMHSAKIVPLSLALFAHSLTNKLAPRELLLYRQLCEVSKAVKVRGHDDFRSIHVFTFNTRAALEAARKIVHDEFLLVPTENPVEDERGVYRLPPLSDANRGLYNDAILEAAQWGFARCIEWIMAAFDIEADELPMCEVGRVHLL